VKRKFKFSSRLCSTPAVRPYTVLGGMKVNERRTVVVGLIGHCVSPNRGERSTRMVLLTEITRAPNSVQYLTQQYTTDHPQLSLPSLRDR